ncbi:MAG: circadian clock KaiB family protein [Bacteroidota bacterium]
MDELIPGFDELEAFLPKSTETPYVLHLYITGASPNSTRAVKNVKEICELHLKNRYELIIIDIYQQPLMAEKEQIIAAPTLVKKFPYPLRRLVGDMSDKKRVLSGLGLNPNDY